MKTTAQQRANKKQDEKRKGQPRLTLRFDDELKKQEIVNKAKKLGLSAAEFIYIAANAYKQKT